MYIMILLKVKNQNIKLHRCTTNRNVGKLSHLERCPQFRGVLIEGFHCIPLATCTNNPRK